MILFDELAECFRDLLHPFHELAAWLNGGIYADVVDLGGLAIDRDARDKALAKQRKERRKYMDDKHMVQFKQSKGPKVIPRDRPYQRRNY